MWVVILITLVIYIITGIMSNLVNIVKFFEDKGEEDDTQNKHKKYKLEE